MKMKVTFEARTFDTNKNKLAQPNQNMTEAVNLPLSYFSSSSQDKKMSRMKHLLSPPYTQLSSSLYT